MKNPQIFVLDEATSALDFTTDACLQKTIRESFTKQTILVIAHRLSTIMDFDRVMVMDGGVVVEMGPPLELAKRPGGYFAGLVKDSLAITKHAISIAAEASQ